MRAYFASLSDYNAGHLLGVWIDLEGKDESEIQDEINAMLRTSIHPNVRVACPDCEHERDSQRCKPCGGYGTVPSAEEWSIHDYDKFPDMGENPSLAALVEAARMLDEHGDAWLAYVDHVGEHYATEDDFSEKFAGEADTEREWVEQWIDDTGLLHDMPDNLRNYFDYDAYLRDMKCGGDVGFVRKDGTVYVFWA